MSSATSISNAIPRPISPGGDPFGTHRSLDPKGGLPQPAERVDNDFTRLFAGEILLAVETLNVDAASFRQMEEASGGTLSGYLEAGVADLVQKTIKTRGKQHNPVTGSGGMLLGRVLQVVPGSDSHEKNKKNSLQCPLAPGDRVASLVSLSLTPLRIDAISAVRRESAQLDVKGEAVLFESGAYAKMPNDMPERLALAVLDVAGAAPQVARLVKKDSSVVVLGGGGKSGILCLAEAKRQAGINGRVIGVESFSKYASDLKALGICDAVIEADARDAVAVRKAVLAANNGNECDVSLSCVNVEGAEMSAILCTRDRGVAYFFAMSTSFTKAALGAEGVGKDVDLMIGNGYAHGHAEHSIAMMREFPAIRALFEKRYL